MPLCGGFEIQLGGGISVNIHFEYELSVALKKVEVGSLTKV